MHCIVEISSIRPGTAADKAGLRPGDRLVTVNEVMVVFLPVSDVMMALNMNELVAYLEFERCYENQNLIVYLIVCNLDPPTGASSRAGSWAGSTPSPGRRSSQSCCMIDTVSGLIGTLPGR